MKDDKILGIRRGFLEVIIILIVLILFFGFMVGQVSAANTTNVTTIPTTIVPTINASRVTPTPTIVQPTFVAIATNYTNVSPMITPQVIETAPPNATIRRIAQGGCVQLGETIDMAGIGWYTGYISYYGKYRTEMTEGLPDSLVKVYEVKPWNLRKFYVNPTWFKDFPGWWYSHYDDDEAGNSRLFKISDNCTIPNTTANRSIVIENKTVLVTGGITIPPKYVTGVQFIVSRNTTTKMGAADNKSTWWLFGNYDDKQYNLSVENDSLITFTRNRTNLLPTGRYTIVFINPGANNISEELYDEENESIVSPFRGVEPIFVGSMISDNAQKQLLQRTNASIDDTYRILTLELQDPYIEVRQLDMGTTTNNMSTMTMSGYTNTNPGDAITIEFDKGNIDRQLIRANTWNTTVDISAAPNAYRTWFKTVLFNPNDFVAGIHTLTVTTKSGATASVPVSIRKELEESYQPPKTVQFIDNNPFVPTPTPIVLPPEKITVIETQIVVQTVQIPVDYDTMSGYIVDKSVPYVIAGFFGVIVAAYALYAVARAYMKERRKRKFDINKGEL